MGLNASRRNALKALTGAGIARERAVAFMNCGAHTPTIHRAVVDTVLAFEWDYAVWTERTASAAGAFAMKKFEGATVQSRRIAINWGGVGAREGRTAGMGIAFSERVLPGPLKPAP